MLVEVRKENRDAVEKNVEEIPSIDGLDVPFIG